jgi:hypothetical protein
MTKRRTVEDHQAEWRQTLLLRRLVATVLLLLMFDAVAEVREMRIAQ